MKYLLRRYPDMAEVSPVFVVEMNSRSPDWDWLRWTARWTAEVLIQMKDFLRRFPGKSEVSCAFVVEMNVRALISSKDLLHRYPDVAEVSRAFVWDEWRSPDPNEGLPAQISRHGWGEMHHWVCFHTRVATFWLMLVCSTMAWLKCGGPAPGSAHVWYLGLAKTVYMHRIWPYIRWFPCQKYRVYTVYIWFWLTLMVFDPLHLSAPHKLPLQLATTTCHCNLSLQLVIATCNHCSLPLQLVTAAFTSTSHCNLSLQLAPATCHCNLSLQLVTAACHCN